MGLKSFFLRPYAKIIRKKVSSDRIHALRDQKRILTEIIRTARDTSFGVDHEFANIKSYQNFTKNVPIRDYEGLRSYFDRVVQGEKDVLWPGVPRYLAKTSGTTSGVKYIPLTTQSIPNHFGTARNAAINYAADSGNYFYIDGKLIFLSGSPQLDKKNGIHVGRLSGISNHLVPAWLKTSQMPSYETNIIDDWEEKLAKIVEETVMEDMRLISGIPPWVQMYYEALLDYTGKKNIIDIFPNLSVFIYGGVNYEPYRNKIESLVGKRIDSVELYPASEGFIAFQDSQEHSGMLLNTNSGIFFEFVKAEEFFDENPTRYSLEDVEVGIDYALIINSNAGLWGYSIGDTVVFDSIDPYRLKVSGRIKHYISAFGEHVIGKEVEEALISAIGTSDTDVVELTVAPQVNPVDSKEPYHEWYIEFGNRPSDIADFTRRLDHALREQNIYYDDLRKGNILTEAKVRILQKDAFRKYMQSIGKLGGQNKVPRLSNDRKIADKLDKFTI